VAAPQPAAHPYTLREGFNAYIATLDDANPRTIKEYLRDFESHVAPAIVKLEDGRMAGPLGQMPLSDLRTSTEEPQTTLSNHGQDRCHNSR
jgi:hypothetical protein